MAQLEHQAIRIENLELMSHYGTNAWKVYNEWVAACGSHPLVSDSSEDSKLMLSLFSNLAFLIELAQKELHKFRWLRIGSYMPEKIQRLPWLHISELMPAGRRSRTWTGSAKTISWLQAPSCESWSPSRFFLSSGVLVDAGWGVMSDSGSDSRQLGVAGQ